MKITLLHTVASLRESFGRELSSALGETLTVYNMLDEFLALNVGETGCFTEENTRRLSLALESAELTHPDAIIVTCSTLTPHVRRLRPTLKTPVICIDEAMAKKAADYGRVLVLATAASTIGPTCELICEESEGRTQMDVRVDEKALAALRRGDVAEHDARVADLAAEVSGYEAVVLAQASMARVADSLEERLSIPVLASPRLCIESVRELLSGKENESNA